MSESPKPKSIMPPWMLPHETAKECMDRIFGPYIEVARALDGEPEKRPTSAQSPDGGKDQE